MTAPWMFGDDQGEVEGRLAAINDGAQRRYRDAVSARKELEQRTVTAEARQGAVRVTVASSGALRDLVLSERVRQWSAGEIAAAVMGCVQSAQAQLAEVSREVFAKHMSDPDDPSVRLAVDTIRAAFPPPDGGTRPGAPEPHDRAGQDDDIGSQTYLHGSADGRES